MGKLGGDMVHSLEPMLVKNFPHQVRIAEIPLDTCQAGKAFVLVDLKIDIDDRIAFAQKAPFQDPSKEARSAGYQNV